jgi:hypothetical protein
MLNFTAADAAAAGNPSKYHDVWQARAHSRLTFSPPQSLSN